MSSNVIIILCCKCNERHLSLNEAHNLDPPFRAPKAAQLKRPRSSVPAHLLLIIIYLSIVVYLHIRTFLGAEASAFIDRSEHVWLWRLLYLRVGASASLAALLAHPQFRSELRVSPFSHAQLAAELPYVLPQHLSPAVCGNQAWAFYRSNTRQTFNRRKNEI